MPDKKTIFASLLPFALVACVSPPPAPTPPPSDTPEILSRIDTLERSVLESCNTDDARNRAQFVSLGNVQGMVEEMHKHVIAQARASERSAVRECAPTGDIGQKHVLGRNEWVGMPSLGSYFKARLDTGANTSSLTAKDIQTFERDGENWVRFKLAIDENDAVVPAVREREYEAKVLRQVRIVQASGAETRPVVRLPLTLGPIEQNVEFTLNDRSHLTYPVLLGRRFMMDIAVIDIGQSYIYPRPEFPGGSPAAEAARDQRDDDAAEE